MIGAWPSPGTGQGSRPATHMLEVTCTGEQVDHQGFCRRVKWVERLPKKNGGKTRSSKLSMFLGLNYFLRIKFSFFAFVFLRRYLRYQKKYVIP